jgi:hypothetical protein
MRIWSGHSRQPFTPAFGVIGRQAMTLFCVSRFVYRIALSSIEMTFDCASGDKDKYRSVV